MVAGPFSSPYKLPAEGVAYPAMRRAVSEAWGREPVDMGVGGSVPFVAGSAEHFPDAEIILTGAGEPDMRTRAG